MMSRHWTAIAMTTWLARACYRHRSGRKAGAIAIHNVNGKKMRSTSALLIPDKSATATIKTPAALSQTTGRSATVVRPQFTTRLATSAIDDPTSGPALKHIAARFPQIQ